jgi:DNA-binding transcriptional ArsR family regulator
LGSTRKALAALLGTTRSAALEILTVPCTTTQLAGRLGVSLATASHHATILRDAGLVTTRRHGSAVLHVVSPLGLGLLHGDCPGGADGD